MFIYYSIFNLIHLCHILFLGLFFFSLALFFISFDFLNKHLPWLCGPIHQILWLDKPDARYTRTLLKGLEVVWEWLEQSLDGVLVIKTLRTLDLQPKFIAFGIIWRKEGYNRTTFFRCPLALFIDQSCIHLATAWVCGTPGSAGPGSPT